MDQANIRKALRGYVVTCVSESSTGNPYLDRAVAKEVVFEDLFEALGFLAHQLAEKNVVDVADGPIEKKDRKRDDYAEDAVVYNAYKAKYDSVFRRKR